MPILREEHTVTLRPRAPHGWTLRPIKHPELDGRPIGYNPTPSTHSIDLTHYLPLGNTAHGRIARHLAYIVEHLGYKQHTATEFCCSSGCFGTCMACTYNYYIEWLKYHILCTLDFLFLMKQFIPQMERLLFLMPHFHSFGITLVALSEQV